MYEKIHCNVTDDPMVEAIVRAAFPSERGQRVTIEPRDHPVTLSDTYWSGGSRSSYALVSLTDPPRSIPLPQFDPPQFGGPRQSPEIELRPDVCVVELSIFRGKPMPFRILCLPGAIAPKLTAGTEITEEEGIILAMLARLNSKGRAHERDRRKISEASYLDQCRKLEARGLAKVNKAGAASITDAGRNALGNRRFGWL